MEIRALAGCGDLLVGEKVLHTFEPRPPIPAIGRRHGLRVAPFHERVTAQCRVAHGMEALVGAIQRRAVLGTVNPLLPLLCKFEPKHASSGGQKQHEDGESGDHEVTSVSFAAARTS